MRAHKALELMRLSAKYCTKFPDKRVAEELTARGLLADAALTHAVTFDFGGQVPSEEHIEFGSDLMGRGKFKLPYDCCFFVSGSSAAGADPADREWVVAFAAPSDEQAAGAGIAAGLRAIMKSYGADEDENKKVEDLISDLKARVGFDGIVAIRLMGRERGPNPSMLLPMLSVEARGGVFDTETDSVGVGIRYWSLTRCLLDADRRGNLKGRSAECLAPLHRWTEQDHTDGSITLVANIVGLVSMLMSKDVIKTKHEVPVKLNEIRAKKKKPQIRVAYEVRVRPLGAVSGANGHGPLNGERKSPKMHWRRGHFRRHPYQSGEVIPIAPMLINADEQFVAPKDYVVAQAPKMTQTADRNAGIRR